MWIYILVYGVSALLAGTSFILDLRDAKWQTTIGELLAMSLGTFIPVVNSVVAFGFILTILTVCLPALIAKISVLEQPVDLTCITKLVK